MTNYKQILDDAYSSAEQIQNVDEPFTFSNEVKSYIKTIVDKAENSKAVLAVIITLMAHKIVVPEDDIRYHQKDIGNFSGRTIDSKFITPFGDYRKRKLPHSFYWDCGSFYFIYILVMQLFYSFCNSKRCVHITKVLLALTE